MIIIAIVISIVFIIILGMIIKAYYDDIIELNERIQVLEKRDTEKETIKNVKQINDIVITNTIDIQSIEKRIEKLERKRKGDKENEKNNTQR